MDVSAVTRAVAGDTERVGTVSKAVEHRRWDACASTWVSLLPDVVQHHLVDAVEVRPINQWSPSPTGAQLFQPICRIEPRRRRGEYSERE